MGTSSLRFRGYILGRQEIENDRQLKCQRYAVHLKNYVITFGKKVLLLLLLLE